MTVLRLVVKVDLANASPREVRERFLAALKTAIVDAQTSGKIEVTVADEIFRAVPQLGDA